MAIKEMEPFAQCMFADDGVHALEKLASNDVMPDFIFIDINMPRMNGIQCLKEIKRVSKLEHVPVYMYSTAYEMYIVDECLKIGATGFIKKEIHIKDLQKQLLQIFMQQKI